MTHRALGVVLLFVVVIAGIGPAAATAQPGQIGTTPQVGSSQDVGPVSAQVGGQNCSFPVTATDATGTEITVEEEPERVVALGASTAQVMWEVGAQNRVVAMPQGPTTAYLDGSQNRTGVFRADGFTVATEQVVGTNPDLVVAANIIPNETIQTLRGAGLTVYKSDAAESIPDVYDDVNTTGRLVGACTGAAEAVDETRETVNAVEQAVADEDRPRVLYPQSGGFAVGNNTFIDDVMETAGGDNIAANAGIEDYQQISNETIAERNPQWIVTSTPATVPSGEPYASTAAVQQNQTVVVDGNLISQPGPRLVVPLTEIASTLHPAAMQQANLTNATAQPPMAADGGTASTQTMGTTTMGTAAATGATTMGADTGAESTTAPEITVTGETAIGAATSAGETMAEATAAETIAESGAATAAETNGSENASDSTETSSSNGPGFGVTVAAIALLGGALLARRRS